MYLSRGPVVRWGGQQWIRGAVVGSGKHLVWCRAGSSGAVIECGLKRGGAQSPPGAVSIASAGVGRGRLDGKRLIWDGDLSSGAVSI